jgi:hypothetical protein
MEDKKLFGSNNSIGKNRGIYDSLLAANVHKYNSDNPNSEIYEDYESDYKSSYEEHLRLNSNLGIVTFRLSGDKQVGIDRETLKKIGIKKIREIHNILDLFEPTKVNLDPRKSEAVIFEGSRELNELIRQGVVIKVLEVHFGTHASNGDGLTPEQQFEAGKIIDKVVREIGLDDIVEVNKAFGYLKSDDKNYLILEKVNGFNFQQFLKDQDKNIPDKELKSILECLISKLLIIKKSILENKNYILGKNISKESVLDKNIRRFRYLNQATNLDKRKRLDLKKTYEQGFTKSSENYKDYYLERSNHISELEGLLTKTENQIENLSKEVYDLIPLTIEKILELGSLISGKYVSDISKSSGSNNVMYDFDKKKLILIDPGPIIR